MWIFALFVALPLIEIGLFVTVGGWLGLWPTLAIVIGSGFLGIFVLRGRGTRLRGASLRAGSPVFLMADGGVLILAGILLILPGFLTDAMGILLLIAPIRRLVIAMVAKRVFVATGGSTGSWKDDRDTVIDGEYVEIVEERAAVQPPSKWTKD